MLTRSCLSSLLIRMFGRAHSLCCKKLIASTLLLRFDGIRFRSIDSIAISSTGELSRADVVIPGDFFTAPSSPLQGVGSEQTDLQLVGEYAIMASERTSEDSPGALDSGRDSRPRLLSPAISDGSQGRSSSGHTRSTSSEFVVEPLRRGLASADSSRASLNLGVPGSRKSRANLGPIFLSSLSTPTSVFASSPPPSPGPNMPTSHSTDNLQS